MAIDMNPPADERLRIATEDLANAKTDWYRVKLAQPDNAQKDQILADHVARAERAEAEIAALQKEIDVASKKEAKA